MRVSQYPSSQHRLARASGPVQKLKWDEPSISDILETQRRSSLLCETPLIEARLALGGPEAADHHRGSPGARHRPPDMSRPASRQASEASVPSRPGSRDMLREASLSRPSTSHSTYSIGAATRGALSPIASEGALSPDRVDVNDRGGVFKLTRPALPPSSLPQISKPRRKKSARSSRSSGSSRSSRRSGRGPAPAPRILERQAAFADGEWENELARSILILYGSAMGCGKEIAGQENDFAVDNDAVKALGSKVTQDEIDAGKQREAASRERREKKKKRPKRIRKPPWESPPDSVVEFEKSQASKAASSKPSISADPNAKPLRPVWYLGTGPVQSEWDCLPEGDDMRLDLQALDEAGKYVEYLSCVEASLNAYVRRRCDGEGEQGRLFGRLWRQLCVTACVFVSRAVDQRRPALAMKLLDRAKQYSVASAAHVQVKADARELQAFVEDAYAYYYYCRGKYHAALHCVVKAMKIHVRQEEHAHVAKCHVHSACILSRLRRRPESAARGPASPSRRCDWCFSTSVMLTTWRSRLGPTRRPRVLRCATGNGQWRSLTATVTAVPRSHPRPRR